MKSAYFLLLVLFLVRMTGLGQEIGNPSFETPALEAPLQLITPGSPGFAEATPKMQWAFGVQAGICLQDVSYAVGVKAADGKQVAFIQGNFENRDPALFPPMNLFGVDVTGLKPGEDYEISWQQTGRLTDIEKTGVTVTIDAISLLIQEPVGTKGKWESKSVWFLATASTMRLNVLHHILKGKTVSSGDATTLFDNFKIRAGKAPAQRVGK